MAHSDVRRYQRRDTVPRSLGPSSLSVPRTKTSHDTSKITTSQTRTLHFTHTPLWLLKQFIIWQVITESGAH